MSIKWTLLFFLAVLTSTAAEFTGSAAKMYVTEASGRFSNKKSLDHMKEDGYITNQDLMEVLVLPVNNIPELNAEYVLYLEEHIAGKLIRQHILALKGEGDVLEIQHYEFVHPESYEPGTFTISSLESLTLSDLKFREECKSYISRIDETSFVTNKPDCTGDTIKRYMLTVNCNSVTTLVYDDKFPESKSKMPYILVKEESFLVPGSIMPDYEIYKALCNY